MHDEDAVPVGIDGREIFGWYDDEWSHTRPLLDLVQLVGARIG